LKVIILFAFLLILSGCKTATYEKTDENQGSNFVDIDIVENSDSDETTDNDNNGDSDKAEPDEDLTESDKDSDFTVLDNDIEALSDFDSSEDIDIEPDLDFLDNDIAENDVEALPDSDLPQYPAPQTGEIVFTEIMFDPDAVADSIGEYIEIINLSSETLSLEGCFLNVGDSKVLIKENFVILSFEYAVLGKTEVAAYGDFLFYDFGSLNLNNTTPPLISLTCGETLVDSVTYTKNTAGHSFSLNPEFIVQSVEQPYIYNDTTTNFCASTSLISNGDFGTPGNANDACTPIKL